MISALRYGISIAAVASGLMVAGFPANASELVFWSMWAEPEPQAAANPLIRTVASAIAIRILAAYGAARHHPSCETRPHRVLRLDVRRLARSVLRAARAQAALA